MQVQKRSKRRLGQSLNKGIEKAGHFLGRRSPGTLLAISGAAAGVVSLFQSGQAQAASATWDGGAGTNVLNTAVNWTNNTAPVLSGDIATWNGTVGGNLVLTYNAGFGVAPLGTSINITSGQTGSLLIGSSAANTANAFSPQNITIDAGAFSGVASGAAGFTLGDGNSIDSITFRNNGTAPYINTLTNNSAKTAVIASNVVTFSGTGAGRTLIFAGSGDWQVNAPVTIGPAGVGSFAITKDGAGTTTLTAANGYTGLTIVNGGALNITSAGSLLSGNALTVGASGTADFANAGQTLGAVNNANTATNALNFSASTGTVTLASLAGAGNTRFGSNGIVTGGISTGTVTSVGALTANISGGTVTAGGVATIGTMSAGTANLNGATSTITTLNGGTVHLGSSTVLTVSGGTTSDSITGSGGSLYKDSPGTLTLSSANTYTGATTIGGGTLVVNGSLAAGSAVSVNNGGTLGGTGTIGGAVTVNSGGHLAPGNSPGALIINNTLTLNSGSVSDFEIASTSSYDQVTGLTGITYGGTLNVTGSIASSAHTYTLFSLSSGTPSGDFSSVNLAAAPTGYRWHDFDAGAGVDYFNNASGTIQLELASSAAVKLSAVANALSGSLRSDTTDENDENGMNAVGTIHVTGSNGGFVSEIDGLTNEAGVHDFAEGYVQVDNDLSPAPTLVMLWLKDNDGVGGVAKSDVINYLAANAGGAYTVLTSSDAAWQKLAGAYSGFDTIIDFGSVMGTGDAFSWKFEGDYAAITVDKVAVVPEPGSLGLLGLGALGLMGSRRRKQKKTVGETVLSRFYRRRRIA